jgi:hypothetical protein
MLHFYYTDRERHQMTIVLDAPEQINAYMLLSIRSTLGLEVKTGMKFSNRVNVFAQAKSVLTEAGIKPKGTKAAVWVQFNALCDELNLPLCQNPPV